MLVHGIFAYLGISFRFAQSGPVPWRVGKLLCFRIHCAPADTHTHAHAQWQLVLF